MRNLMIVSMLVFSLYTNAQVGIGTTSPNSTLDLRGSLSTKYTSFTANTSAGSSDNMLVFTGTTATTLTLPDATACQGRIYWIKNASSTVPAPVLTVATTASQTIDGSSSWKLDESQEIAVVMSNGTNWNILNQNIPVAKSSTAGSSWNQGGNRLGSSKAIGTISNYDLPFITNNTERMRLNTAGNFAIGTSTFDGTNPEKFLVDAGTTSSVNAISAKGTINSYLQLNIQNKSSGVAASSDIVATADNGTESANYIDLGINSSGYTNTGILGGANRTYLYGAGGDFAIGNTTSGKNLIFFTGGTATTNERMRIDDATGYVGIGTTSPNYMLHLHKSSASSNWMQITNSNTGTGTFDGFFYGVSSSGQPQIWGAGDMAIYTGSGTTNNMTMTLGENGNVGIGTSTFNVTNPEQLVVDCGTTTSVNAIVGKGTINNYLQLNIQNLSTGTSASSDVVATANNGSETTNYVDMGINGSGNTSGVMGGADDAYLYNVGQNFLIGTATAAKSLVFMTGGQSQSTNERMRIDGSGNVGISTTTPKSVLDVDGSVGFAIRTTSSSTTLDATDYTVIITANTPTITLPSASSNTRRIYVIVNQTGGSRTISTYKDFTGSSNTGIPANSSIIVQSNGTSWYRIQ